MSRFFDTPVRWRLAQGLARNPLVRTSDRVEALALVLAVAVSFAAIAIGGALGSAVHADRSRVYAREAETRHMVAATAVGNDSAVSRSRTPVVTVQARWRADGADHLGALSWDHAVKPGESVGVWVDRYGNQAAPPTPSWRAVADAAVAATGFWLATTAVAAGLFALFVSWLNRLRYAGWERDITALADNGGGRTRPAP